MKKMTLDDLRKFREEQKKNMDRRETAGKSASVIVGMGTCGIAAGAKAAFDAFLSELDKAGLKDVAVKQTGCMGLCHSEPTAEVIKPGMPRIIYGRVTAEVARRIVHEHLAGGTLVSDHVFDYPAADIVPTLTPAAKKKA